MRALASWTTRVEIAVLEWLGETQAAAPPKVVYANAKQKAEISYNQVKRRMRLLRDADLLENDPDRGDYYALTEDGWRWFNGELDRDDLEERDPT